MTAESAPLAPSRRLFSAAVPWMLAGLAATWRVRRPEQALLVDALQEGPVVFAFFHGHMIPLVALHRQLPVVGLASRSQDGEILAQVIQRLGYGVVRGSSSRGGAPALRDLLRALQAGSSPAVAVDGPRGPRHVPQPGVVGLAAMSGRPIVYAVARCGLAVHLSSWDRTCIPLPGAAVEIHYGLLRVTTRNRTAMAAIATELGARMRLAAGEPDSAPGQGLAAP